MTELIDSPRWLAIGLLVNQNAKDFLAQRYGLVGEIISWFKVISLFRDTENERMILEEPTPSDLRFHKTWMASLVADGERLVTEIQRAGGLPANPTGIKPSDVEAVLESLRITENAWHGDLPAERRAELWKGVFNVEEPGA